MSAPVCMLCKGSGERERLIGLGLLAIVPCFACDGTGRIERRVAVADTSWDGNGYLSPVTGGWRECRRLAERRKGDE